MNNNTLLIGIDGNEANVVNRVGSNRFAYGIIWGLYRQPSQEVTYIIYLKQPPLPDMPSPTIWWQYRILPPSFAWTQWRLPLDLFLHLPRPQVFFSPGHYAPRYAPMPTVVSVMDLAFLSMPQLFLKFKRGAAQLANWTQYSVHQATAVIAISQHTKQDIHKFYGTAKSKIHIVYPGIGSEYQPATKTAIGKLKKKYGLTDGYILHVGTLQPRKNILRLIQAFELLPPGFKQRQLVLAGQSGWLTDDIEKAINTSSKHHLIVKTGYVPPDDLPILMSGAACLVQVGLYEGFGMPPAEALACDTVPVVSHNSSLPEVVGQAGILVDPYSVASIKNGIMVALKENPEKRALRLKLGRQHISQFNWDISASIINQLLISLCSKTNTANH
jgi:glycosyltransferase involved in cell wall biosynthesis